MKQTKLMVMAMMAVALMATSCASKKDLQNCQNENKELSSNYQVTKEKLDVLRRRTDSGYEFGVRRPDGRYAALALLRAEA